MSRWRLHWRLLRLNSHAMQLMSIVIAIVLAKFNEQHFIYYW